ncbi:hypothetical protein PHYSODRAFT_332418 [Phytophthora sojae]|uniref:Protein kinase domain-containing protein n=1 Tax=Phytophthora sojae (strain P6497) TaxID=1094619 RepID=G4ZHL3_PHYSP|nr:hypothetical protein PHYSODRAFT_332418 [Phytophthora sojae]EGZ18668.1 hypothetical protein PHYSODRAFT_332418 [Phytophthora sojae]|eukprot:XP_009527726.1 hypothetical protein PHYSODRAFT_332418 [Phytophthora sojae]
MLHALRTWHESGYCHGDIRWENMVYVPSQEFILDLDVVYRHPGYWMLVKLESPRRSSILMQEQDSASKFTCQSDLFHLGTLMKTLEFPLTHRLLWIQQKLLSARDRTEAVTAKKVLAKLNRTKKCQSDDLQSVANVLLLPALHTPEMTPESMLVMMKEMVPPAQVKAAESSGQASRPSRSLSLY